VVAGHEICSTVACNRGYSILIHSPSTFTALLQYTVDTCFPHIWNPSWWRDAMLFQARSAPHAGFPTTATNKAPSSSTTTSSLCFELISQAGQATGSLVLAGQTELLYRLSSTWENSTLTTMYNRLQNTHRMCDRPDSCSLAAMFNVLKS
jgi:hypothetical protein